MDSINRLAKYPEGAEYAMLTKNEEAIQCFYKMKEVKYNDGTKAMVLYYTSEFPWAPSSLTLEGLLSITEYKIVSIQ